LFAGDIDMQILCLLKTFGRIAWSLRDLRFFNISTTDTSSTHLMPFNPKIIKIRTKYKDVSINNCTWLASRRFIITRF
jgi:hypothetical protein